MPFYSSLEEQNAQKWWVNGKVYPLFSKRGEVMPSQIMREHTGGYHRGEEIEDTRTEQGYIELGTGEIIRNNNCLVATYDVDGLERVFVVDAPKLYDHDDRDGTSVAFFNSDHEFILNIDFINLYTGVINIPANASTMILLVENNIDNPQKHAVLYTAEYDELSPITSIQIVDANTGLIIHTMPIEAIEQVARITHYADQNVDVIQMMGIIWINMPEGRLYLEVTDDIHKWYSEVFTSVADVSPLLKLEWWDNEDFVMESGVICYQNDFKNVLYLCSDIAKPEYNFTEDVEERDGYTFAIKQVSEKKYKFSFWSPEYLLDVLRFVRMADNVRITKNGKVFTHIDTFLMTPEWESVGDLASVDVEFTTETIAKKLAKTISTL